MPPLRRRVHRPGHEIRIHPRRERAPPVPRARGARRGRGVRAEHIVEPEPLLGTPGRRAVGERAVQRREHALARIDGRDRHVAAEHQRSAPLEQRPEGVGSRSAPAPVAVHQRNVGEEMSRLHRGHDPRACRPVEIGRVHALEVLDPVRQRGPRERSQELERATHGRIADGVDGTGDPSSAASRMARSASPASVSGMPRSRLPS